MGGKKLTGANKQRGKGNAGAVLPEGMMFPKINHDSPGRSDGGVSVADKSPRRHSGVGGEDGHGVGGGGGVGGGEGGELFEHPLQRRPRRVVKTSSKSTGGGGATGDSSAAASAGPKRTIWGSSQAKKVRMGKGNWEDQHHVMGSLQQQQHQQDGGGDGVHHPTHLTPHQHEMMRLEQKRLRDEEDRRDLSQQQVEFHRRLQAEQDREIRVRRARQAAQGGAAARPPSQEAAAVAAALAAAAAAQSPPPPPPKMGVLNFSDAANAGEAAYYQSQMGSGGRYAAAAIGAGRPVRINHERHAESFLPAVISGSPVPMSSPEPKDFPRSSSGQEAESTSAPGRDGGGDGRGSRKRVMPTGAGVSANEVRAHNAPHGRGGAPSAAFAPPAAAAAGAVSVGGRPPRHARGMGDEEARSYAPSTAAGAAAAAKADAHAAQKAAGARAVHHLLHGQVALARLLDPAHTNI